MKQVVSLLLLASLLLSLSACISLTSARTETETATGAGTEVFLPTPEPWEDADTTAAAFLTFSGGTVDCSKREYSHAEMAADLQALAAAYPSRFSCRVIGQSAAGRDLYVGILGNPEAEKKIVVSAAIHGREYLTALLTMKQIEFYLTYYDTGYYHEIPYRELFTECCFYIVPMTNPDGVMLSQEGLSSLTDDKLRGMIKAAYLNDFRKGVTVANSLESYLPYWKANANAVDLNRNFDALWSEYAKGSPELSRETYKGSAAASEPETRAMVSLVEGLSGIQAVLCVHSQGEVIYWDCGQEPTLRSKTSDFAAAVARVNGYRVMSQINNDASFSDWCALKCGLIALTVETGDGNCPLPLSQLTSIWEENYALLPAAAAYFH